MTNVSPHALQRPSVFALAISAAAEFREAEQLQYGDVYIQKLADRGCYFPLCIGRDLGAVSDTLAEELARVLGDLLTLACKEAGRNDVCVAAEAVRDRGENYTLYLFAGTDTPYALPLSEFPSHAVEQKLYALRKEMLGESIDRMSPYWEFVPVLIGGAAAENMEYAYRWDGDPERGKLAGRILAIGGARRGKHSVESDAIVVPREDLEARVQIECRENSGPPLNSL